jgi:dipeptidyl aminopeptidase/acylaminoacyl peptidase
MRHPRSSVRLAFRGVLAWALAALPLAAQQAAPPDVAAQLAADRALLAKETYQVPPPEVAKLVTAPRWKNVSLTRAAPNRRYFLKEQSDGLTDVTAFGKPHYYFAGLQVDFKANRARSLTTRGAAGLEVIDATTGKSTTITTPANATVSSPVWSPDGNQLAFMANFDDGSQLYVADVATGKSRQVTRTPLLATLVTTVDWTADGKSVIAVLVPEGRGPEPAKPAVATGPEVRLWIDSVKSAERNWASLLETPYDAELMEYYVTGQLALIDVKSRAVRKIGAPAMIERVDAGPEGLYLLVTTMRKPFSYVVPYGDFGETQEIWDASGKVLAEVSTHPTRVGDDTTRGPGRSSSDTTRRDIAWMPAGQGLYYLERAPSRRVDPDSADADQGNGRPGRNGGRPDRLVQWLPPFGPSDTKVLYTHDAPISDLVFSDDAATIFVASSRNGTGEIVGVNLDEPTKKYPITRMRGYTPSFTGDGRPSRGFFNRRGGSPADSLSFFNDPGALVTKRGTRGGGVAQLSSDGAVFLSGIRYSRDWMANPPRPFVDKVVVRTGAKSRIFEGASGVSESVGTPLDDDFSRVIVTRESPTTVPNAYLVTTASGASTQLTQNVDYQPEFTSAVRRKMFVTRPDGIKFLVDLTLPADYRPGTRLPAMLWFYPYEFTEQASYDRSIRTEDVNRFPNGSARTIEYLVTQGYAVANFDPPIVGPAGRMNDNYVSDLRMNVATVIDALDRDGYIDRARLAIGGHSYGAFSTANAMVHTPFFKAGIAGDGMYNRTLTPNGFQNERRDLWSGQRAYIDMSPMLDADHLQGALLMYHGMEDQNVGTTLISSIRMMQALRTYGKTAALYMYPYEDHGPGAEETLLDLWSRWSAWLDIYVKHAGVTAPKPAATTTAGDKALQPR